jgi:hypothetical protein
MTDKILSIANPMIGETALPDFGFSADESSEFMRISALDQLDGSLDGDVVSWSEQEMDMIGHQHEGMQEIAAFAAVVKKSFEE